MMDLTIKGSKWVRNIYQKFEAICHEVDDIVKQDTFKYVEDQMQSVGDNVKKLCTELLPPLGNPIIHVAEDVASEKIDSVCTNTRKCRQENYISASDYLHKEAVCVLGDSKVLVSTTDPVKMDSEHQLSLFSSQHNHVEKLSSPASKDTLGGSDPSSIESSDANIKEFSTNIFASVLPDSNSSSVVELFTESPMGVFDQKNDTNKRAGWSKNKPETSTQELNIESLQNWALWDDYIDEVERIPDSSQSTSEISFLVVSMENTAEDASLAFFIRCDAEESSIISKSSPENVTHEEIPCHKSIEGAAIVFNFSVAAHEALEHSLECRVDSAALDAEESDSDSVHSSVVCSVVSEDTSTEKIGVTSFYCSNAKPVELSEDSRQKLLREAILCKYVDVSSSDIGYCHTESIVLLDKTKIQENSVNVEDNVLRAISRRVRKQRSFKKQILDALTSKKRLVKEYEQLAIWFGDVSLDSNLEANSRVNNSGTRQAGDFEWELL